VRVLVAGKSGQLARELARLRWPEGTVFAALGRPELDIADANAVARAFTAHRPDVVINAAAYTAVDAAERERDLAFRVNADGVRYLARESKRYGAALIQVSTDYVFGGPRASPWQEDDMPAPQGVYAQSKLAGETAVRDETDRVVILRTSWLFAARGRNFVRTIIDRASHPTLAIVDDQIGCPTPAADLARVIAVIAMRDGPHGVYHYCGDGAVTWFQFAKEIFAVSGLSRTPELRPISSTEFGAAAPRPAYSVLDTSKIARDYGIERRPWRDGLMAVLAELGARAGGYAA
jgi:dTDP-4-dehydrorhamnose reductase